MGKRVDGTDDSRMSKGSYVPPRNALPPPPPVPRRRKDDDGVLEILPDGTRVFLARDGSTVELSEAEFERAEPYEESARPLITGGADGRERLERDLGLEIDPTTGRAYTDQGDFHNLGLSAGGRFRNQKAVPRAVKCGGCGITVIEKEWGQGFHNCGAFDFDPAGEFFLCPECVSKVLRLFPRIRGILAARVGGKIRT